MAIQFNNELQKFYDYIQAENDNNRANDDAAVQYGANRTLGAATKTANAVRRWFCLTDSTTAARKANNDIRAALFTAVAREYKGLANIPQAVKTALKMKDFECEQKQNGTLVFKSGKPLTQRRISAVINAIIADRNAQISNLKDQLNVIDPGKTAPRQVLVQREIILANPNLTEKPGVLNLTGENILKTARRRFLALLNNLDKAGQIEYLANYKTHARDTAQFVSDLTNRVSEKIDELFADPSVIDKFNAPDRAGKPADERRIAIRKRILKEAVLRWTLNRTEAGNQFDRDMDFYLERAKNALWTEDSQPTEDILELFAKYESIADIAYTFVTKAKAQFGIDMPGEIVNGLITSTCVSNLYGKSIEESQKKANGFVEMFQTVLNACEQDKTTALKIFSGIVHTDVTKPKFVTLAKEVLDSLDQAELEFPAECTNESLLDFCRDLTEKVFEKTTAYRQQTEEFGAQDMHDVVASFVMMLFTTREEAANWLHAHSAVELELFANHMNVNEFTDPNKMRVYIFDSLVSTILAAKIFVDA